MLMRNVQFENLEEVMAFCNECKKIDADIDVRHKNQWIDAKSVLGLMSLELGAKMELVVYEARVEEVDKYLSEYYVAL